jgi:hypothetical protein
LAYKKKKKDLFLVKRMTARKIQSVKAEPNGLTNGQKPQVLELKQMIKAYKYTFEIPEDFKGLFIYCTIDLTDRKLPSAYTQDPNPECSHEWTSFNGSFCRCRKCGEYVHIILGELEQPDPSMTIEYNLTLDTEVLKGA